MIERWRAEITYRSERPTKLISFEEIQELHDIVEQGPDWNEINHIVVTLNDQAAKEPDAFWPFVMSIGR